MSASACAQSMPGLCYIVPAFIIIAVFFQVNLGWSSSSTSVLWNFFIHLFQRETFGDKWHRFLWAKCPFCHPNIGVNVLTPASDLMLTSSFLHPPSDSQQNGRCSLQCHTGCSLQCHTGIYVNKMDNAV